MLLEESLDLLVVETSIEQTAAEQMAELDAYLQEQGIEHFTAREICRVGRLANGKGPALKMAPRGLWPMIIPTLHVLEELRDDLDCRVIVHCGYRDPDYNRAVGGVDGSVHPDFNAIDLEVPGFAHRVIAKKLAARPDAKKLGIGLYRTFVHFDTRGKIGHKSPARWWGAGCENWPTT